jgi:hypothetical protein
VPLAVGVVRVWPGCVEVEPLDGAQANSVAPASTPSSMITVVTPVSGDAASWSAGGEGTPVATTSVVLGGAHHTEAAGRHSVDGVHESKNAPPQMSVGNVVRNMPTRRKEAVTAHPPACLSVCSKTVRACQRQLRPVICVPWQASVLCSGCACVWGAVA